MFGRPAQQPGASPQVAFTPSGSTQSGRRAAGAKDQGGVSASLGVTLPLTITIAALLLIGWAILEHHHSKLRAALKPGNIGANLHNAAKILATVVVGVPVLKVAAVKYAAMGLPGGQTLSTWIGST
jgi:hypothetical protein